MVGTRSTSKLRVLVFGLAPSSPWQIDTASTSRYLCSSNWGQQGLKLTWKGQVSKMLLFLTDASLNHFEWWQHAQALWRRWPSASHLVADTHRLQSVSKIKIYSFDQRQVFFPHFPEEMWMLVPEQLIRWFSVSEVFRVTHADSSKSSRLGSLFSLMPPLNKKSGYYVAHSLPSVPPTKLGVHLQP